jgi:hypothetical protein
MWGCYAEKKWCQKLRKIYILTQKLEYFVLVKTNSGFPVECSQCSLIRRVFRDIWEAGRKCRSIQEGNGGKKVKEEHPGRKRRNVQEGKGGTYRKEMEEHTWRKSGHTGRKWRTIQEGNRETCRKEREEHTGRKWRNIHEENRDIQEENGGTYRKAIEKHAGRKGRNIQEETRETCRKKMEENTGRQ